MDPRNFVKFRRFFDKGKPPDINDTNSFPVLANPLDKTTASEDLERVKAEHERNLEEYRYIVEKVTEYISDTGADMPGNGNDEKSNADVLAYLEGMNKKLDANSVDIKNVDKKVDDLGRRVNAIELGEKPKKKDDQATPPEEKEEVMDTEEGKEGGAAAAAGITPAKEKPILAKTMSPGTEESWAKRAAMGGAMGTPKLDALMKSLPAEDPIRETLPFMEPKVKRPLKKAPTEKQMDKYDVNQCQIVTAVKELHDQLESESRGKGAVRGAKAGYKAKMTNVRKIMTAMSLPDPRDGRRKSMLDGEKVPDGRYNFWFQLESLERLNADLANRMEHFKKQCNDTKRIEEQALIEKSRQKLQIGPFYPEDWEKLDKK